MLGQDITLQHVQGFDVNAHNVRHLLFGQQVRLPQQTDVFTKTIEAFHGSHNVTSLACELAKLILTAISVIT